MIWTSDFVASLARRLLVKTSLVEIISASSMTPYNLFGAWIEFPNTYGTIAFDSLSLAIFV